MANPITKILHFAEEIQNVHSAGSPIEVTECEQTPTPTPSQDNYIEINHFPTDNVQISINAGYTYNDTDGSTDTRRVVVSDGIGEDAVYEADDVVNIWYGKYYSDTIERKIVIKGYVGKFTLTTATRMKVKSAKIKSSRIDSMSSAFLGCSNMEICDLSEFDTSKVTSFNRTFYGCNSLTSLDVSHFNLSGILSFVEPFQYTFYGCSSITNSGIDFSDWSVDSICAEDTTGFRQNAGFSNEPAWNENCQTPTPDDAPSLGGDEQTPTPIAQQDPTPTPFDYGADLCPVSYGYYSSLHNFWVTPDKKLIAFSRKSGDIYPKYPSEFVTIDTDVVDMNITGDTCFYKKSDNKLYGIGSNTTNKINSDNTMMYFATPQLIASDVKNFGLDLKGVWYVSTADVGYYKGEDRPGIIDGSNQYDANKVLTSFVEVATNVDHMSIATNSSLLPLVVFNDKKLKYKGTIPALSADLKEEWTLISDNVLKALATTVKTCFYLKTDNTLHGIAPVVDGVLGEPVTVPAGINSPWNYTEHRQIAENVIDFHAKQTSQIHYIDKENNLYGRGLSYHGWLGNAITKTRNPAGNTATSNNAAVVATWQLIDENVSNLYFNGGGSYKKYDGSLYICGNPPSVNMVVYPYVGLLETSVLTDYPHKVCNAYLDSTPTPTPTSVPTTPCNVALSYMFRESGTDYIEKTISFDVNDKDDHNSVDFFAGISNVEPTLAGYDTIIPDRYAPVLQTIEEIDGKMHLTHIHKSGHSGNNPLHGNGEPIFSPRNNYWVYPKYDEWKDQNNHDLGYAWGLNISFDSEGNPKRSWPRHTMNTIAEFTWVVNSLPYVKDVKVLDDSGNPSTDDSLRITDVDALKVTNLDLPVNVVASVTIPPNSCSDWVAPTPTPDDAPSLGGDDANELEFRWADGIIADEKILQVRNLLKPTHSDDDGVGNFDDRDMSDWSTLYTSTHNEDGHDLSSAFWPDAAVDENYSFAKTISIENATIILANTDELPTGEVSNLNYYQLYIDFDNSNADLHPSVDTGNSIQALYIYHGDTDNPSTSASGATNFNSVVTLMSTTVTTSEATAGTKTIQISNSDTTKFKAGMNIIISPDNDAIREENVVESLGSLNLQNNLQNTHPQGSQVIQKPSSALANGQGSTTPTPSSSPSPNECDGLSAIRCNSPYAGWNYVRPRPTASGDCYYGCTQCEDGEQQCGANTKEENQAPLKRSYNLGCGFPECECLDTVPNGWNGPQFNPSPQNKTYTRVNATECEVDKPTCDQAFKTVDEARASAACQDDCNGVAVEWNDDICAWECVFTECDQAKVNCLEQNPPECGNGMNGQNTKSGGNKTLNPNTCEWEDCECIDIDPNNADHNCFDKNGVKTGPKTMNPLTCEFEDCCEEEYIPSDCANNKVRKVNTDCTEGPCECVKDEVDDEGCGLAAVGHGPEHSVWDEALCKYNCECDWEFIEAQDHNVTMMADCNDADNKKLHRNEANCTLECICDPEPCPPGMQGVLNDDTCEYENCECTEKPDNTTQMCADGTTQQTWDDTECKWTPECPVCPDDKVAAWQLPNGDPCNPNVATIKTFFGLSMNLRNEWENVFDGLSIKFGEQETANGVDYLPIYAKVDNNKITLSSGNNVSEWNKLYVFVGDNKNPNVQANGEGIEFDTIVSDNYTFNQGEVKYISAKIPFRFADINGIPTLQIKNILKPTNSAFNNRDVESEWSSVYVGPGYDLNDDVWPSASVGVNYEIGPITYSSLDCNQVCLDPTPTPVDYEVGGGT